MVAALLPVQPVAPPRPTVVRQSVLLETKDFTCVPTRLATTPDDGYRPWSAASRRCHEREMAITAIRDAEKMNGDAFAAVKRGDIALMNQRLAEGADINALNADGDTLAIVAAKRQDEKALHALALLHADGRIRDRRGMDVAAHVGPGKCLWLATVLGGNPFIYRGIDRYLTKVLEIGPWRRMCWFALNAARADYEDANDHGRLPGLVLKTLGPEAPQRWKEGEAERVDLWRRSIALAVAGRAWPDEWRTRHAALVRARCEDVVLAAILLGDLGLAGLVSEVAPE